MSFGTDDSLGTGVSGSRRLTVVLVGVALLLVGLVLWPPTGSDTRSDARQQTSVAGWPARGSLASDSDLARSVAAAWRSAAREDGIPAPGPEVGVVFLDDRDGILAAVVHSRASDGRLLLAVGRATRPGGIGGGLQIIDAVPVPDDPPWLVLPGGEHPRLLVAPDLAQSAALVLRRDDGLWTRLAIDDDGVSVPVRSLVDEQPMVGVLGGTSTGRAMVEVRAVSSTSLLPVPPPVTLASPSWGRAAAPTPEEYDAALTVGRAVAPATDPIAVIAAARIREGRAVLAEIQRPGEVEHVLAVSGADSVPRLVDPPRVEDSLALGLLPREGGRWLVLAGAAPEVARLEVQTPAGQTLIGGAGSVAVVLPAPAPAGVVVTGERTDGSAVGRLRLPIAQQAPGEAP